MQDKSKYSADAKARTTPLSSLANDDSEKHWKTAFWIVASIILLTMLLLSHSYGLSGDEWLQMKYGHDIWNYFANGDQQALNYDNMNPHYFGLQYYGGLFDFFTEILHHWFPSVDYIYLRHFINSGTGATMMIFTGLLARRLSCKWSVGVLALLFIFFSPRIFGESMNNPKDIPFACGFIIGIYSLVVFLQDYPIKANRHAFSIAIGFAIAFGIRSAGGFMLLAFVGMLTFTYYTLNNDFKSALVADRNKLLKRGLVILILAVVAGYIISLLAWPWGLQSPVSNPLTSLKEMTNRRSYFKVLFEGVYRMNYTMPWHYELKWICISNPLIVLLGVILFAVLASRAIKQYGLFALILLVTCSLLPLLYIAYKHATVYDTWRHVFFVYPFWIIIAAMAFDLAQDLIKKEQLKKLSLYLAIIGLLPAAIWMIRSHPNQYVYFNELAGGIKGAYGQYELDYYQNTAKETSDWIKKNAKTLPGKKIVVLSNMLGVDEYFRNDTSRFTVDTAIYEQRHFLNYDYFISNGRYIPVAQLLDKKWPPQNVAYTVALDGIPLSVILTKKSYAGYEAYNAFKKEDYTTAVLKYEQYLAIDSFDESVYVNYALSLLNVGNTEKAIAMLNKASTFNPLNASYYDGLKSMYELTGDNTKAQDAANKANAMRFEDQELNPLIQE